MWCLEGEECVACKFQDRDELRWVLQKWEEEFEVGKILHPTQSHAEAHRGQDVISTNRPRINHSRL